MVANFTYLPVLHTGGKIIIIKNKGCRLVLLKFRINIRKQYLSILHTGFKMFVIKNEGPRVDFIKV